MPLETVTFAAELEHFEYDVSSEGEADIALYAFDTSNDRVMAGSMRWVKPFLPTEGRSGGTQYYVRLSFSSSTSDVPTRIETRNACIGVRADYMGTKTIESNAGDGSTIYQPMFVLRDGDSDEDASRKGILTINTHTLPNGKAFDFVDLTDEFEPFIWDEEEAPKHMWPSGEPYESYSVTVEFELSPGILDDPPRKHGE